MLSLVVSIARYIDALYIDDLVYYIKKLEFKFKIRPRSAVSV